MKQRLAALYPLLFAMVPVLHMADNNPGYFTLGDLLAVLAAVLLLAGAIYGAVALVLRGRGGGWLAPLVTLLVVAALFAREPLRRLGLRFPPEPQHLAIALAGGVAVILALRWLAPRPALLRTGATFLTLTGTLLVLRFGLGVALDRIAAGQEIRESAVVRELARPIPGPASVPGPRRDIYLIVLDEYANDGVLRELLGFDNRPFLDSLRALGFQVPAEVRSNYAHTTLSLPSLLNAAQLERLEQELPPGSTDPTILNRLVERSRVAGFLQERGYRFVFFPSAWWIATLSSPEADSVVRVRDGFDPRWEMISTAFRRSVRDETFLTYLQRGHGPYADHIRRSLDGFARLPSLDAPVFAFAHVLSPHWPFVFDRGCRPPRNSGDGDRKERYLAQLQCLNTMLLEVVTRLVRESEVPPIILLQGDHGTKELGFEGAQSLAELTVDAARERLGAFGAYYLPGDPAPELGDTVTVVNVLGEVLRRYFGAELPREPDALFLSLEPAPYDFVRLEVGGLVGARPSSHTGTRR